MNQVEQFKEDISGNGAPPLAESIAFYMDLKGQEKDAGIKDKYNSMKQTASFLAEKHPDRLGGIIGAVGGGAIGAGHMATTGPKTKKPEDMWKRRLARGAFGGLVGGVLGSSVGNTIGMSVKSQRMSKTLDAINNGTVYMKEAPSLNLKKVDRGAQHAKNVSDPNTFEWAKEAADMKMLGSPSTYRRAAQTAKSIPGSIGKALRKGVGAVKDNPIVASTVAGAGIGGAAGYNKKPEKGAIKDKMYNAGTGAIAGASGGLVLGSASMIPKVMKLNKTMDRVRNNMRGATFNLGLHTDKPPLPKSERFVDKHMGKLMSGAGAAVGGGLGALKGKDVSDMDGNPKNHHVRNFALAGAATGALAGGVGSTLIKGQRALKDYNELAKTMNSMKPSNVESASSNILPRSLMKEALDLKSHLNRVKGPGMEVAKYVGGLGAAGASVGAIRATGEKVEGESVGNRLSRIGNRAIDDGITGAVTGAGILGIHKFKKPSVKLAFSLDGLADHAVDAGTKAFNAAKPHVQNAANFAKGHLQDAGMKTLAAAKANPQLAGAIPGAAIGGGLGAEYTNDSIGAVPGAIAGGVLGAKAGPWMVREAMNPTNPLFGQTIGNAMHKVGFLGAMAGGLGKAMAKSPRLAGAGLSAVAGGTANKLTGGDFTTGALAAAPLGALGGKRLLGAVANKSTPLLGKSVQQGAVGELQAMKASRMATKSPAAAAVTHPVSGPGTPPAAAPKSSAQPLATVNPQPNALAASGRSAANASYMSTPMPTPPTTAGTASSARASGVIPPQSAQAAPNPLASMAGKNVAQPGSATGLNNFSPSRVQPASANNNFYATNNGMRQTPIKARASAPQAMQTPQFNQLQQQGQAAGVLR